MNEDYFFYLDDIDWGKRMKERGVAIRYFPEARVLIYKSLVFGWAKRERVFAAIFPSNHRGGA